jgi:hypothetical protein
VAGEERPRTAALTGILAAMQWHWGNIGSMLQGVSVIVIAVAALIRGPAVIRAWLDRQAAGAEEARARAESLRGDAEERRLERRRTLLGWSPHGVETYSVALVTDPAEMDQAKAELAGGGPTSYVVLRVDEGEYTSPNRGRSLRMLVEEQLLLCRPPTAAEREALDAGFEALGIRNLPPASADARPWY